MVMYMYKNIITLKFIYGMQYMGSKLYPHVVFNLIWSKSPMPKTICQGFEHEAWSLPSLPQMSYTLKSFK